MAQKIQKSTRLLAVSENAFRRVNAEHSVARTPGGPRRGLPMEAADMETSSATSRAPNPACPFESGVRADKINFPDVLEVLPLRDAASDGETDAARRAGDGDAGEHMKPHPRRPP